MDQNPAVNDSVRNGRPWWQICCGGCLLLIIAVVIGALILFRVFAGGGIIQMTSLPANYPKALMPYHLNEATSITYLKGKDKSKMLNTLYAPIKLFAGVASQNVASTTELMDTAKAVDALGTDAQYIDTVTITWKGQTADRADAITYYDHTFSAAGLAVSKEHSDVELSDVLTGVREGIYAQATIQPGASTGTIDAELVVSYSNK